MMLYVVFGIVFGWLAVLTCIVILNQNGIADLARLVRLWQQAHIDGRHANDGNDDRLVQVWRDERN